MPKYALFIVCALFSILTLTSCVAHAGYRAYDPYRSDYHMWGPGETTYYNRWVVETHQPRRDYRRLNRDRQSDYWRWRHDHN